jgi:DNA polymerase III epsilon subunit-like protein
LLNEAGAVPAGDALASSEGFDGDVDLEAEPVVRGSLEGVPVGRKCSAQVIVGRQKNLDLDWNNQRDGKMIMEWRSGTVIGGFVDERGREMFRLELDEDLSRKEKGGRIVSCPRGDVALAMRLPAKGRVAAHQSVKDVMVKCPYVFDTETTGLGDNDQIVQISLVGRKGNQNVIMLDTLVKPSVPMNPYAMDVHKITEAMLAKAPTFPLIYPVLKSMMEGTHPDHSHQVGMAYNFSFDLRMINQTARAYGLDPIVPKDGFCLMEAYKAMKSSEQSSKLVKACEAFNIALRDAHTAKGDAMATLELGLAIAERPIKSRFGTEEPATPELARQGMHRMALQGITDMHRALTGMSDQGIATLSPGAKRLVGNFLLGQAARFSGE